MRDLQSQLIRESQAERLNDLSRGKLSRLRAKGKGPRFYLVHGCVMYDVSDVAQWIAWKKSKEVVS